METEQDFTYVALSVCDHNNNDPASDDSIGEHLRNSVQNFILVGDKLLRDFYRFFYTNFIFFVRRKTALSYFLVETKVIEENAKKEWQRKKEEE